MPHTQAVYKILWDLWFPAEGFEKKWRRRSFELLIIESAVDFIPD